MSFSVYFARLQILFLVSLVILFMLFQYSFLVGFVLLVYTLFAITLITAFVLALGKLGDRLHNSAPSTFKLSVYY